jgi:hypothetical protein
MTRSSAKKANEVYPPPPEPNETIPPYPATSTPPTESTITVDPRLEEPSPSPSPSSLTKDDDTLAATLPVRTLPNHLTPKTSSGIYIPIRPGAKWANALESPAKYQIS